MRLLRALLLTAAALAACAPTEDVLARSKKSGAAGITHPATMDHTGMTTGGGTGGTPGTISLFVTPTITRTSTSGTNPPTWDLVAPDAQQGDTIQLDFTTNGSAPDGTAEESHTLDSFDEAITWSTWTGLPGGATIKWAQRYGRTISGTPQWSNWSNVLSDVLAAAPFDPASLFGGSDVGFVWNPTDLTKVAQNNDGTVTGVVGSPVGRLVDLSGKGSNLNSAANGSTRPTLASTNNGMISCDGVDDELQGVGGFYAKGAITIIMVVKGSSQSNFLWAEDSSSSSAPIYAPGMRGVSATQMYNYQRNDASTQIANAMNAALLDGSAHVEVVKDSGSVVSVSIDGGTFVTNSYTRSGTYTTNRSTMCVADVAGTLFGKFTGSIGAGIIISRQLTGTLGPSGGEITNAYNWVAAKNGLPTL